MAENELDLVSRLSSEQQTIARFRLTNICPDDGKYGDSIDPMRRFLSPEAEWNNCAKLQHVLLETRAEFGQATSAQVDEVKMALRRIDPLNMALLENKLKHDQLAVIEEIGRFVSPGTKALLHPGTTSYDILDTARAYLMKRAWREQMRPTVKITISNMIELSEQTIDFLQVGRTHLQNTSPILFGGMVAGYAARLADRVNFCDKAFYSLKGKISGIVGTGAGIDMVIGPGKSIEFEQRVLEKFGLLPDYSASQITQKERMADVGHGMVTLISVLGDFANDMRMLYSSSIHEVSDRKSESMLGGSSSDAAKDNPINWENIAGKVAIVEGGMRVCYAQIESNFERDLRGSIQARYQPGMMIAETYESFARANKGLKTLSINIDYLSRNLQPVRDNPSEAMVSILRGEGWIHPEYGAGHDFVKAMALEARKNKQPLIAPCLEDKEFVAVYDTLPDVKRRILRGEMESYMGSARERALINLGYAREVIGRKPLND